MPKTLQFRRGNTSTVNAITAAEGEILIDTDKDTVIVGDGILAGGYALARDDKATAAFASANSANDKATAAFATANSAAASSLSTSQAAGGMKNRIINGDMRISQRRANVVSFLGTNAVVVGGFYGVDRFSLYKDVGTGPNFGGNVLIQQTTTAPTSFNNSLRVEVISSFNTAAQYGEYSGFFIKQSIEGYNTSDLAWGTANAKSATLSFWVRSSNTGTFSGSFQNGAYDYSYPFSYTISSANTWEYKTFTVAGPTSGTWIGSTNGTGIRILWDLGSGSNYRANANSWIAQERSGVTGSVNLSGAPGSNFYLTGVQFEEGSTATTFERRSYGTELSLCERYYQKSYQTDTPVENGFLYQGFALPSEANTSAGLVAVPTYAYSGLGTGFSFRTVMRAAPSVSYRDANRNFLSTSFWSGGFSNNYSSITGISASPTGVIFDPGNVDGRPILIHYAAAAEIW